MNKYAWIVLALALTGCVAPPEEINNEAMTPTTPVDAVEGKATTDTAGLVDKVRRREDAVADDPAWAPVYPQSQPEHYAAVTGSLFNIASARDLYDSRRPKGLGDIVTVLLEERTQAKKSANADMGKSTDLSMDPLSLGGQDIMLGNRTLSYNVSNDNSFTGSTSANQSNSISGTISVEVVDVMPNGNLLVRGERWLTLNTGDEYIRLSGTIRPDDIGTDNTIASTRISNARIQYSGTGEHQDAQEQGFLGRFFNVAL
ncbi:flagellar basal body L-ring protein FlgH [Thaumasiovibrio sp. DFM-14]|uniref:flagellar basal body L-ring protein FlgH n=1 Tax=Thaumasiovibrio sp. DFM-14 TaxID=3384792 RepID=UPI0039A022B5